MQYKRKEVIGDCTLYEADCMDILPSLSDIQAIITDPPYGIEGMVGGYGREGRTIIGDKDFGAISGLIAALPSDCWLFMFYSSRATPQVMEIVKDYYCGEIIWDKKAGGMGAPLRYQHENIAVCKKGVPANMGTTFTIMTDYRCGDIHPHEKPVPLMEKLCSLVDGETILDPFMGSGTTGVACAKMGRKFIGIELEERYFDIACKRIEEAYKQPDLFLPKTPHHKAEEQESLL